MQKILYRLLFAIFLAINGVSGHAATETLQWYVDNDLYATTTCESGGDVTLPTAPTKYGYTFQGWTHEYKPVEYLVIPGRINNTVAYIDTGIIPTNNTVFRVKLNMGNTTGDNLIGTGATISSGGYYNFFNYSQLIFFDIGNDTSGRVKGGQFSNNTTYDFLVGMQYVKDYTTSNIIIGTERTVSYTPTNSLKIYSNAPGKLYLFQIWENEQLVRDFIPVLDANNIPCLYDKVEGIYHYNTGPYNFYAGPIIE